MSFESAIDKARTINLAGRWDLNQILIVGV